MIFSEHLRAPRETTNDILNTVLLEKFHKVPWRTTDVYIHKGSRKGSSEFQKRRLPSVGRIFQLIAPPMNERINERIMGPNMPIYLRSIKLLEINRKNLF